LAGAGCEPRSEGRLLLNLRDYLQILARRKWLVMLIVVAIPAAAVVYSLQQDPAYRATAEVLLSRQDIAGALSGTPDATGSGDADRDARTQSELARVPAVAAAAIEDAGIRVSLDGFIADSGVTSSPKSDLLTFEVEHGTREGAQRLVNAYARAFARYREALDTSALRRARRGVLSRLRRLEEDGQGDSALQRSLEVKDEELRVLQALQTSRAAVVRRADSAEKVRPKPVRNGILALVLALMLGVGLAFVRDTLDTRMRSAHEIAERLKLPLLARLPRPPRQLRKDNKIVMLAEPHGHAADAFRVLRTNLDLANVDGHARTMIFTSAVQEEGKSTTIANLGVAAARAGRRIVLVDLDLRRGDLDELFGLANQPGITDVALGEVSLGDALVPIDVNPDGDIMIARPRITSGAHESTGSLELLTAGWFPADTVGDFVVSDAVSGILRQLTESADLVIVDAPPMLQTSDAMALASRVDAIVVVTRLGVRRPTLDELSRTLTQSIAKKLGVVVTGDEFEQSYYGGYYGNESGNGHGAPPRRVAARRSS
jgi:polysaccharide biosynthesis transport protein